MHLKNLTVVFALIFASIFLVGCQSQTQSKTDQLAQGRQLNDKVCEAIGDLAEAVMEGRQNGLSFTRSLQLAKTQLHRNLVFKAYNSTQYYSKVSKRDAGIRFRNDAELNCQKQLNV